jgi:AcrR family transcriptional regulator
MAQRSKKDHIAAAALPLFLENGFKGTSIDMVVRVSGVSKPTVYNHFPDKAALMLAVLSRWIENNKPLILPIKDPSELEKLVRGRRFPSARKLFWGQFDRLWRVAFGYVCEHSPNLEQAVIDQQLDRQLLDRLRAQ